MNKLLWARICLGMAIVCAAGGWFTDVLMLTVSSVLWLTAHVFWILEANKEKKNVK